MSSARFGSGRQVTVGVIIIGAILNGAVASAQRPAPPPKPKPAPASAAAAPAAKPAPGPSTTAARAPSAAAARVTVRQAFRAVLPQPTVRTAVKTEVLRQLAVNRPVALISGMWATLIDMGKVYGVPTVRTALVAKLPAGGGIQVNEAILDPGRIGISFTPGELGSLLGTTVKDVKATLGVDAAMNKMTDGALVLILAGLAGAGAATLLVLPTLVDGSTWADWLGYGSNTSPTPTPPYDPNADPDNDGKTNMYDEDDDDDGYPDEEDQYPDDPNRHICDCGRPPPVVFFGTSVPDQIVTAVLASLDQARAQLRAATALGAVPAAQTASIRIVVP